MITFSDWNNPEFRLDFTFDNNATFTTQTNNVNTDNSCCINLIINEKEANIIGNPLGVFTSNSVNIEIVDKLNVLIPTNTSSPYYGYMRNGVQIDITDITNNIPFGTYYVSDWNVDRENGEFGTINIMAEDKLTYIGNMEVPELPAYIGLDVKVLLKNLLNAIGLTDNEFYIDPSLTLNMSFSITKGSTVRDVLNSIAQSLIARITLRRDGKIYVMPAFPTINVYGEIANDNYVENYNIAHNTANTYNKVKLSYNQVSNRPSEILQTLNNVELVLGENVFSNIEIPYNVLSYDGVYVEYEADEVSYDDKITSISFQGFQGGISITINSAKSEPFLCNIEIAGKSANITDSYVESIIQGTDVKVANVLNLTSFVIQTESDARAYIAKVITYLQTINQQVTLSGLFSTEIEPGMYIKINSDISELDGIYYVDGYSLTCGQGDTTSLSVLKMRS